MLLMFTMVLLQSIETALAALATFFNPTERRLCGAGFSSVDSNHAHLQLSGDPHGTVDIQREEVTSEAKLGVVGHFQHFILRLELEDWSERPECLIVAHHHLLCYAQEHSGLEEEAGRFGSLPASFDLGTF